MRLCVLRLLLACTLAGFLGQLALQSRALPGEMPRVTFERVTGLHIAAAPSDDMACGEMPGMDMPRPDDAGHADRKPGSGSCPLCPLLHLPVVVLAFAFLCVLCGALRYAETVFPQLYLARLRSGWHALRPPPTGPPAPL